MYRIIKEFGFEAAHQLGGLPDGHQCARLHGHSYRVEMVLEAEALDARGFVRDYGELKQVGDWINETFDHRLLNETIEQPTAERIAKYIFLGWKHALPELAAVRVSETRKTWAEYREGARA